MKMKYIRYERMYGSEMSATGVSMNCYLVSILRILPSSRSMALGLSNPSRLV
jgi:hypothetical protein